MRLFSYKKRPVHLGPYPLESLKRTSTVTNYSTISPTTALNFQNKPSDKESSDINVTMSESMGLFMAMLDSIRYGHCNAVKSDLPTDPNERAKHLKAAGYYFDATQIGVCELTKALHLKQPYQNPQLSDIAELVASDNQVKSLASGIDVILNDIRTSLKETTPSINNHTHAMVFLIEHPREPKKQEVGSDWIQSMTEHRSALRVAEVAVVLSNYLRLLGFEACAHTMTSAEVDLNKAGLAAGLLQAIKNPKTSELSLQNPFVKSSYSLAAITTTMEIAIDMPLAKGLSRNANNINPSWWLGLGHAKSKWNYKPYKRRRFVDGQMPFERIKRQSKTTTFIDEQRIPRVPKRTDMFARGLMGDMGKKVQDNCKGGYYIAKSPIGICSRRALGALLLLQDGEVAKQVSPSATDPQRNADNIKAACNFLGVDAVGLSDCPDYVYYSHDGLGQEIIPYHNNAISMIIDQGHETMEGSSGDDWIAVSQSMRAYLRASLYGGVIANHIRKLGYNARVHSVLDGEVLQPPLLLLSGLGEVSRIGEVILNPYLGPRLKSGVVTTDMPMVHDQPIDFGLQSFCENCNKCARECPSGAITAGPKKMFNGYEIWKSDSQRCTQYRLTNTNGAMCGRCMKTCPWNLEGLFKEAPFRWLAMNFPKTAKHLAWIDDKMGNGNINPIKKWWWDIELKEDGSYGPAASANARHLQPNLEVDHQQQVLAVYPAYLAPQPYPIPQPMVREQGVEAHNNLLSVEAHKQRIKQGDTENLVPSFTIKPTDNSQAMAMRVTVSKVEVLSDTTRLYELTSMDGESLPTYSAGAHIDVSIAPEYFRQYSLLGDPKDTSKYVIAVLYEANGRGGSKLMHQVFNVGRTVIITPPRNHFPVVQNTNHHLLIGGGIGITPLIAMAHELHHLGQSFELHYCCSNRQQAAFVEWFSHVAWSDKVEVHLSSEGSRLSLNDCLQRDTEGQQLYTCGPVALMDAVFDTALQQGWPSESLQREYFAVPDDVEWENHPFKVKIAGQDRLYYIPADKKIVEVLNDNGIEIETKCSDGLCGVCVRHHNANDIEHRDYILSKSDRDSKIITCCSRASKPGGLIELILD